MSTIRNRATLLLALIVLAGISYAAVTVMDALTYRAYRDAVPAAKCCQPARCTDCGDCCPCADCGCE